MSPVNKPYKWASLIRYRVACLHKKNCRNVGMILRLPTCKRFMGVVIVRLNSTGPLASQFG